MQYRKALVTGGAGFLGSHLVDALIDSGIGVVVIDKVDPLPERKNAKAEYVRCNIQEPRVKDIFASAKPDVLFHLAAHLDDRASLREPVANAEDNILGSLNVFEAARAANVKKIIFASTGVLYGNVDAIPTNEDVLPKPLTPYGVSKLTGERYLNFYWSLYKLPYVALRIGNIYGPGQDASKECGVIAIYTDKLLAGKTILANNDGLTTRDYVYVSDVVAAMLLAAGNNAVGVYNIGNGAEVSTNAVQDAIAGALSIAPNVEHHPEVMDIVKRVALDSAKAKQEFGWQPKVALADGIAATVAWYKARL